MLAAVAWDGGGDATTWTDPLNWSGDALPATNDDVTIDVATTPVIQISGENRVHSLVSAESLILLGGGVLQVDSNAIISATLNLAGGALKETTVSSPNGAEIVVSMSGLLDAVSLQTNLVVGGGKVLHVRNGLTLAGGILTVGPAANEIGQGYLYFDGTNTISGTGSLLLRRNPDGQYGYVSSGALTIDSGITVTGSGTWIANSLNNHGSLLANVAGAELAISSGSVTNTGTIEAITGGIINLSGTVTNTGTIKSTNAGLNLEFSSPNTWTNQGTISVVDSTLELSGTIATADLNTIHRSGGQVNLSGTLMNAGTTLSLDATTGSWNLKGGKIVGGHLKFLEGSTLVPTYSGLFSDRGGILDGVTLESNLSIIAAPLRVRNGITLLGGTLTVGPLDGQNNIPELNFEGTNAIAGSGTINIARNNLGTYGSIRADNLTINSQTIVRGIGYLVAETLTNYGTVVADTSGVGLGVIANSYVNFGTMEAKDFGALQLGGAWRNAGVIKVSGSAKVELGGTFKTADIGRFDRSGGDVSLTGTLNNANTRLVLDSMTGSWILRGGSIVGGRVALSSGASLIPGYTGGIFDSGGILDGVTLESSITVSAPLRIRNGITLTGGVIVVKPQDNQSNNANLNFAGVNTISGSGTVLLARNNFGAYGLVNGDDVTIGAGITVRGVGYWTGSSLINQGLISADVAGQPNVGGQELGLVPNTFNNQGILEAKDGGALNLYQTALAPLNDPAALRSSANSTIAVTGNILGNTRNVSAFNMGGTLLISGGNSAAPRLVEALSRDSGSASSNFRNNFAIGSLALASNTYARLVDQFDNASGIGSEALYLNSIRVPAGSTLDLGGLNIYARTAQIDGGVINGEIHQLPDAGALTLNQPTPGMISVPGELDEWQVYGLAGRLVSVFVNAGFATPPVPIAPQLTFVEVQLLDPANHVLASTVNGNISSAASIAEFELPASGIYKVRVKAPTGQSGLVGNYILSAFDVTPDNGVLVINRTLNGVIETELSLDRWTFSAVAGQQIRLDQITASAAEIAYSLSGPEGYVAFANLVGDSELVSLPYSGNYALTVRGLSGQTGNYSFQILETSQLVLPVNSSVLGTISGTDQAVLYRIEVPDAKPLYVSLDDTSATHRNELYLSMGKPPTRADYDYRAISPNSPDQALLAPTALPGTWYALIYSTLAPSASEFSLSATTADIRITKVSPDSYGADNTVTMTVTGAGFDGSTEVSLLSVSNNVFAVTDVRLDSFGQITTTFDLHNVPIGTYSVQVSRPGVASDVLINAFRVTAPGQAKLETRLILPDWLGRHEIATLYVEYANRGSAAMPAPVLILQSGDLDGELPILTLEKPLLNSLLWNTAAPENYTASVQIYGSGATPGLLQPGEVVRVPVYFAGIYQPWDFSDQTVEFELRVHEAGSSQAINWLELNDSLQPTWMADDAWSNVYANLQAQIGPTWGDYIRMLSDNALYLARLGEQVIDVSKLYNFELQQAMGVHSLDVLASAIDLSVAVPGLSLDFGRSFGNSIVERFQVGPFGRGWASPWNVSLQQSADRSVTLRSGGTMRVFTRDSRSGGFFSQPGDSGKLKELSDGSFQLTEASGSVFHFYQNGRLDYVQDFNGNRITLSYTGGKLVGLSHSNGSSLAISYNGAGLVDHISDSAGRITSYIYDPTNTYLLSVVGIGGTISYSYDVNPGSKQHTLLSIADATGVTQSFDYDTRGRLTRSYSSGNAESVNYSFDSAGGVTATDAEGVAEKLYFDYRGLIARSEDFVGGYSLYQYNELRQLVRETDSQGHSRQYAWSTDGHLKSITDEYGFVTSFALGGPRNQVTSFIDARGNVTRYGYDAVGNLTSTTYPDNSVERIAYDALGNPTTLTITGVA